MAVWMCLREQGGEGSLQHLARFLCEFTLPAEDDDSDSLPSKPSSQLQLVTSISLTGSLSFAVTAPPR